MISWLKCKETSKKSRNSFVTIKNSSNCHKRSGTPSEKRRMRRYKVSRQRSSVWHRASKCSKMSYRTVFNKGTCWNSKTKSYFSKFNPYKQSCTIKTNTHNSNYPSIIQEHHHQSIETIMIRQFKIINLTKKSRGKCKWWLKSYWKSWTMRRRSTEGWLFK